MRTRRLPKKTTITHEQWDKIQQESAAATELLTNERFAFFREYLENRRDHILQVFAKRSIRDAHEIQTIGDVVRKVFFPQKHEYLKRAGEYELIEQLFHDLEVFADMKNEAEKLQDQKLLVIGEN